MVHLRTTLFSLLFTSVFLSGCGSNVILSSNDAGDYPSTASSPPIQGSLFGGHAPIVGAKLYILTPSTTANAGTSISLMSSTSSTTGGYPVTEDTSGGVTNGMYYITTDSAGGFNLTGDYTCTVDQPVYIAAVGGSPVTPTNGTATVSSISVGTTTGSGSAQTATVTFTTSTTELFYVGQTLTLSGFSGKLAYLNSVTPTVIATGLSTTQFEATISTWNGSSNITGTSTGLSATATGYPPNNPAIINMTALGLCPSSGSFAGHISYIYMNEISTAALAYATAAFGTDAFHIGVNESGTLNKTGDPGYVTGSMVQAFNNASLLYDITGSNESTTFAGEGHIARSTTPSGNGTVPQKLIDTLGNILAACVDSATTSSTTATQCSTLFATATANGTTTGTQPTDIATAAFNIAHYPAGINNSSFATKLFNIPVGNVPFAPNLSSAPNDFSVVIQFTVNAQSGGTSNLINNPEILSLDGQPAVGTETNPAGASNALWIGSYGAQPLKLFTSGTPDYTSNSGGLASATRSRSVAIDNSGNAWIMNESTGKLQKFSDTGTLLLTVSAPTNPYALNYFNGVYAAIDGSGNIYSDYEDITQKITSAGVNIPYTGGGAGAYWSANNSSLGSASNFTNNGYFDSNGLYYTIYDTVADAIVGGGNGSLCVANPATAACNVTVSGFTVGTETNAVTFSSIDGNNTFWSTGYYSDKLLGYNYTSKVSYSYTGGGLNNPSATAIDGAGNIWVANAGNGTISAFTPSGTTLSPTSGFLSGELFNSSGQTTTYGTFSSANGADLVIDRAGDIWVLFSGVNNVDEVIGVATPAVSPTAYATFNGYLGKRPL